MTKNIALLILSTTLFGQNLDDALSGCEKNIAKECTNAASIYMQSDKIKAFELFKKSCDLGDANSCSVVGSFLIDEKKYKEAKAFFDKSCLIGNKLGCDFAADLQRSKQL
ncbi:MAG: hypothetical protein ACTTJC_00105 [Campylobacter sp.]